MPRGQTPTQSALVRRARKVLRVLGQEYPQAVMELECANEFQMLVAVVLSAQTTDVRVNSVTPALFARFPDAAALAGAQRAEVEQIIRPTGFFRNKAAAIIELAAGLEARFAGQVPADRDQLMSLAGVGRKTANVVLGNAFNQPEITVDTHVGRLARRLGWTTHTDPVKVETDIGDLIARQDWTIVSHRLIFHGRRVCFARKPACGACVIARQCPSFGEGETDPERAAAMVLARSTSKLVRQPVSGG